jgi:hypothetical protein
MRHIILLKEVMNMQRIDDDTLEKQGNYTSNIPLHMIASMHTRRADDGYDAVIVSVSGKEYVSNIFGSFVEAHEYIMGIMHRVVRFQASRARSRIRYEYPECWTEEELLRLNPPCNR